MTKPTTTIEFSGPGPTEPPRKTTLKKKSAYDIFLNKYYWKSDNPALEKTNTRIPASSQDKGGSWHIPADKYPEFLQLYHAEVFERGRKEYFTEKQLKSDAPILIDVDLRYDLSTQHRLHTEVHVRALIDTCITIMKQVYILDDEFAIYVMQKPAVNITDRLTKDGLHVILGVKSDPDIRTFFRERLIELLPATAWRDLPLTNPWADVIDPAVISGKSNWQMYGSCKPGCDAYCLTHHAVVSSQGETTLLDPASFDLKTALPLLSARYDGHPEFMLQPAFCQMRIAAAQPSPRAAAAPQQQNSETQGPGPALDLGEVLSITTRDEIDRVVQDLIQTNYEWREVHDYVMTLPETYYGEGSYQKWYQVGCALHNTSARLFPVWLKFSARSPHFDFTRIDELIRKWEGMETGSGGSRLTRRSIMFWCKEENPTEFKRIYEESVDTMLENSIRGMDNMGGGPKGYSHSDLAHILWKIKQHEYVCSSVKTGEWYKFENHRWKLIESGTDLRACVSGDFKRIFAAKFQAVMTKCEELEDELFLLRHQIGGGPAGEEEKERVKSAIGEKTKTLELLNKRSEKIASIIAKLGDTTFKNNIMTEARELFYNPQFLNELDTNKDLLCFANGVVDFKAGVFRRGTPEDLISMSTHRNYVPLQIRGETLETYYHNAAVPLVRMDTLPEYEAMSSERCWFQPKGSVVYDPALHGHIVADIIKEFMNKIYTNADVRHYMWQHLASACTGYTSQTFNMYVGNGQNGKSALTNIMAGLLGDYKGDVPLSLITEKRQKIGGLAPEIAEMKGKRYMVIQEPSKGDRMNEGIMKQLTSGIDMVEGRGLWKPSPTRFFPQFKLVICCNNMLEVGSMDGGTWRRIRKVDHTSRFMDAKDLDPANPLHFRRLSDKELDEKLTPLYKDLFLSLLVDVAYKTQGSVQDCEVVLSSSREYQDSQNVVVMFLRECIDRAAPPSVSLSKSQVKLRYAEWLKETGAAGRKPSVEDVFKQMELEFGAPTGAKWRGIALVLDDEDDDTVLPEAQF